jgi:hypothetical protein
MKEFFIQVQFQSAKMFLVVGRTPNGSLLFLTVDDDPRLSFQLTMISSLLGTVDHIQEKKRDAQGPYGPKAHFLQPGL